MAKDDRLIFDLGILPHKLQLEIDGTTFGFRLSYNPLSDAYYLDVLDEDDVVLLRRKKLVYGENALAINDPRLPLVELTPLDETGTASESNFATFQKTVFLTFVTDHESEADDPAALAADLFNLDDSDEEETMDDLMDESGNTDNLYGTDETVDGAL